MLSRKDYEMIAKAILQELQINGMARHTLAAIAERMAVYLQADNPRFDRKRFLTACGFDQQ